MENTNLSSNNNLHTLAQNTTLNVEVKGGHAVAAISVVSICLTFLGFYKIYSDNQKATSNEQNEVA